MARIAFAWELGGSYGHAISSAALARALHLRGHRIALIFRELHQLTLLPEASEFDVFQAPRYAREGEGRAIPANYADILLGSGYADPRALTALIGGWRALLSRWSPDLLVADFAPTALAAARGLGVASVTYGNGFFTPPRLDPLPPFRHDEPVPQERLVQADAQALASLNTAMASFGGPSFAKLAEQFEVEEDFLCTFPELDHYGTRPASGYWGPRIRFDRGLEVDWPAGNGKRVFVYVQRSLPQIDALIERLASGNERVIAFIPDLDEGRRARLAARHRIVAERPLRLDLLLRQCDLLVCHGGEIAVGALMFGVPQLLFPTHYEQYLLGRRLEQIGSGAWLGPQAAAGAFAPALDTMLANERFRNASRAFAARYSAFSPQEQRRRIVARIEEILAKRAAILTPSQESGDGTR